MNLQQTYPYSVTPEPFITLAKAEMHQISYKNKRIGPTCNQCHSEPLTLIQFSFLYAVKRGEELWSRTVITGCLEVSWKHTNSYALL